MKKGFLSEIKRLDLKNPYKKYEGKFLNEQDWFLYMPFEEEEEFECAMAGSFSECFEYLEEMNILSHEAEQLVNRNVSPSEYASFQKDYREKVIKQCFEEGTFKTDNWAIENEEGLQLIREQECEKSTQLLLKENICPYCGLNNVKRYTEDSEGLVIFKCHNPDCTQHDREIFNLPI